MKNLFKVSLFAMGVVLSSGAMAATGTGHAQVELTNPLTVTNTTTVDLGVIAIDPGAGAQTVSIAAATGTVTCPATYVCSGTPVAGSIRVTGAPSTAVNVDITGSTATLDDGSANQLTFDPIFDNATDQYNAFTLDGSGIGDFAIGGSIDFTGTEVAGVYTSTAGSGYTITVNY
ncbi:MAG: DUF4402 domain-containing protein [Alphaproteobacteria bacterium]|nr:DUF4402 domain-containing protein [Alphaproteobacteria bacterium]MBN2780170.1 DUF4402 domain-containing protein [Alphaproteobacteria bacterium]